MSHELFGPFDDIVYEQSRHVFLSGMPLPHCWCTQHWMGELAVLSPLLAIWKEADTLSCVLDMYVTCRRETDIPDQRPSVHQQL